MTLQLYASLYDDDNDDDDDDTTCIFYIVYVLHNCERDDIYICYMR